MREIKRTEKTTFKDVLLKLSTTYTTTITDICNDLKTPRPWVSRFIVPYLDKVYLSNGYDENGKRYIDKVNWNFIAHRMLKIGYSRELNFYNTIDYIKLIKNSIVECKRQTIVCSPLVFFNKRNRSQFIKFYNALDKERQEMFNAIEKSDLDENSKKLQRIELDIKIFIPKIDEKLNFYFEKSFTKEDFELYKEFKKSGQTHRSKYNFIDYECDFDIKNLIAVHDLKGYAGVDEMIYRELFNKGAVKLVFNFKDKLGNIGKKVFYYYDKEDKNYYLENLENNKFKQIDTFPYEFIEKYAKI